METVVMEDDTWNGDDSVYSDVQLDHTSPASRHQPGDLDAIVCNLSNPLHSVVPRTTKSEHTEAQAVGGDYSTSSARSSPKHASPSSANRAKCRERHDIPDKTLGVENMHIHSAHNSDLVFPKDRTRHRPLENKDKKGDKHDSQEMNVTVTVHLGEDEDEDIPDMSVHSVPAVEEQSSLADSSPDNSGNDMEKDTGVKDKRANGKEKESKKRRFRKIIGRPLRRSHSAGCQKDLQVPEHAHFLQYNDKGDNQEVACAERMQKSTIHKTCSADAAMMANEVFPTDPSELSKNKSTKSSLAKNVKRKLKALRRRNTDSALGAAIMRLHGTPRVSPANAAKWAESFETLLNDNNGLDIFREFLTSEFSDENIEFWIACEEFKTIRTNKLVSRAQKIYSDFVAVKSPKQVNLDSNTRLETVTSLEYPTREMFKAAQKRIQFLMENDSYARFLASEMYLQLLKPEGSDETR